MTLLAKPGMPLTSRKWFPPAVFAAVVVAFEVGIALSLHSTTAADIPVTHGATSADGTDALVATSRVDAYMRRNMAVTGVPGAILAIVKDGNVLHTAGYGYTSAGVPVTPDTPLPIASLTKGMTAAAVMRLVESGALALDEPVVRYIPEFALADARGAQITVRHLLNHTSGLSSRTLPPQLPRHPQSLAEEIQWLRSAGLAADPGTRFEYCNDNYVVLASIVERVSGMPFEGFLTQELFGPLQMRSSHVFFGGRDPKPGVPTGHALVYGVPVPWEMPDEVASGAGGAVSSANDLARWLVLHTTRGKTPLGAALLTAANVDAMHTASAPGSNYGFGWRQEPLPGGAPTVHHSGIARVFTAHARLFPETGYAYAVVIDGGHFFAAEAASFMYGLNALMTGGAPNVGPPFSFFGLSFGALVDRLAAILTAVAVTIGVVGGVRARAWAERRAATSRLVIALRLAPYAAMLLAVAAQPWVLSVINRGALVDPRVVYGYWPPFGVLSIATALSAMAVLLTRCAHLAALKRRGDSSSAPSVGMVR